MSKSQARKPEAKAATNRRASQKNICMTFDRSSLQCLELLMKKNPMRKAEMVRSLITRAGEHRKQVAEFREFYATKWVRIVASKTNFATRFNWSSEIDDMVTFLAQQVLGTQNKSELLRLVICFYAQKEGILKFEEVKYFVPKF